jgi:dipeptidyl-peptidase-4
MRRELPPVDFPEQYARTRRFTLGIPRSFTIAPDGRRLLFLRSLSGTDPRSSLWALDLPEARERVVASPDELRSGQGTIPPEELARRERVRERHSGIVAYATDAAVARACFALDGSLFAADLEGARVWRLPVDQPVVDPRLDPTGARIAYASDQGLHLVSMDGAEKRPVATPEAEGISYGLAEHVAAEEMERDRGFWWSPDGSRLLVARVDTRRVRHWQIADPADPERPPTQLAYPMAGTENADVSLHVIGLDGTRIDLEWDRTAFEYVVAVTWHTRGLLVAVQSRDQRRLLVLEADPDTGATSVRAENTDPCWTTIVRGVPSLTDSGDLVWSSDLDGARRLIVGGTAVTPPQMQVRAVADVDGDDVLFAASTEPTTIDLWRWSADGGLARVNETPGVYQGRQAGGVTVLSGQTIDGGQRVTVLVGGRTVAELRSLAEEPSVRPRVELVSVGSRSLRAAVVLPTWHTSGVPLPVLMDPYGGPAMQRVLAARDAYLASQWFADQGFAVVIVDGRGTPGRGPDWERTIHLAKSSPALEDQVEGLQRIAERHPELDLSRVGIRGWSYGGYLAALAVLRRPDVFRAAVAGAPVTDQRLYDTHYQERYLGHPDQHPEVYDHDSLIADASKLSRPLLLIHGLADDNVVVAHTLRLSAALLAAGRPHAVLPLPRVTHSVVDENVAANLLRLEAEFLLRILGPSGERSPAPSPPQPA